MTGLGCQELEVDGVAGEGLLILRCWACGAGEHRPGPEAGAGSN